MTAKKKTLSEVVAGNLKKFRLEKNLTQEDLADRAGLSVSYISMLERHQRSAPLETLAALCGALRVGVAKMFEDAAA